MHFNDCEMWHVNWRSLKVIWLIQHGHRVENAGIFLDLLPKPLTCMFPEANLGL